MRGSVYVPGANPKSRIQNPKYMLSVFQLSAAALLVFLPAAARALLVGSDFRSHANRLRFRALRGIAFGRLCGGTLTRQREPARII